MNPEYLSRGKSRKASSGFRERGKPKLINSEICVFEFMSFGFAWWFMERRRVFGVPLSSVLSQLLRRGERKKNQVAKVFSEWRELTLLQYGKIDNRHGIAGRRNSYHTNHCASKVSVKLRRRLGKKIIKIAAATMKGFNRCLQRKKFYGN